MLHSRLIIPVSDSYLGESCREIFNFWWDHWHILIVGNCWCRKIEKQVEVLIGVLLLC